LAGTRETDLRAGRVLELDGLFVDPDRMRRGVGRHLVQAAGCGSAGRR
jgi:GNAT superfamily N-acetyltransferase